MLNLLNPTAEHNDKGLGDLKETCEKKVKGSSWDFIVTPSDSSQIEDTPVVKPERPRL